MERRGRGIRGSPSRWRGGTPCPGRHRRDRGTGCNRCCSVPDRAGPDPAVRRTRARSRPAWWARTSFRRVRREREPLVLDEVLAGHRAGDRLAHRSMVRVLVAHALWIVALLSPHVSQQGGRLFRGLPAAGAEQCRHGRAGITRARFTTPPPRSLRHASRAHLRADRARLLLVVLRIVALDRDEELVGRNP